MVREIPVGSTEIQVGLWLYEYHRIIGGTTYTFRQLFSADGYCFYNLEVPENYNEDGNLKPPSERLYAQWAAIAHSYDTVEKINANFISVPIEEGYEIVNISSPTQTI